MYRAMMYLRSQMFRDEEEVDSEDIGEIEAMKIAVQGKLVETIEDKNNRVPNFR